VVACVEHDPEVGYDNVDLNALEFACFLVRTRIGVDRELTQAFPLVVVDLETVECVFVEAGAAVLLLRLKREKFYFG